MRLPAEVCTQAAQAVTRGEKKPTECAEVSRGRSINKCAFVEKDRTSKREENLGESHECEESRKSQQ